MITMDDDTLYSHYTALSMGKARNKAYPLTDSTAESTMYVDYPASKPFINDDYERPPYKSVSAYPEGNRKAVISALKTLQGKIHQLEVERTAAEDNLKSLASETNKYRDILQQEREQKQPSQTSVSKHNQELESQLSAAETRCDLLEKQLAHMNSMVQNAERNRQDALRNTVTDFDIPDTVPDRSTGFKENLRKIADLEREHIKLTANQSLAESKIRELEDKLGEERQHRRFIVEKAAEIESVQKANRILQETEQKYDEEYSDDYRPAPKPKRATKKKKKVVSKKTSCSQQPESSTGKHYRLNIQDIPFVAGKNTGPSHSVGANVQRVFSMMKSHNLVLCSQATQRRVPCRQRSHSSSEASSPSTESDLAEILSQLQDEFHQMSFEHKEFSKEISETSDSRTREDLERELDALVTRMEAKCQQISKIRKHQEKLASKKKKKKSRPVDNYEEETTPRPRSACTSVSPRSSTSHKTYGEVEVTTTIKSKPGAGLIQIRPSSARELSLNVLKDMKKLQTTLRKDDLCWK